MDSVFNKKRIVLGVTGGIAAYKSLDLISRLKKEGADIKVIMTKNATQFVSPLAFETISQNQVHIDSFSRQGNWDIEHISLAKWGDMLVIIPATANIIGKIANGIADDLLSTTVMASNSKVYFAPAMNTAMYNNPIVQRNINSLKNLGYEFISPSKGRLACGDFGDGKLAELDFIYKILKNHFSREQTLQGVRVLVTAGPTWEAIDPVRFIANPSTGKMGYSIARACLERGAQVTLITGPTSIEPPIGVNLIRVKTALEMYNKTIENYDDCNMVFMTAAVGDYRAVSVEDKKIKKVSGEINLKLVSNPDILKELGSRKTNQILIGFAAETNNLEEYARIKLQEKNLDFILGNDVSMDKTGFATDTNQGILINRNGEKTMIPLLNKLDFSRRLLDEVLKEISFKL